MHNIHKPLSYTYLLLLFGSFATAQITEFPIPPQNPNRLFYLQRPANTNTIIYELNIQNNIINKQKPIHIYWIDYATNGHTEELNQMQQKYAYGVKVTEVKDNIFEFYLIAYKKIIFTLQEGDDKLYHAYATINDKKMIVNRIYLEVKGGSLLKPHIEYVELKGTDAISGLMIEERIQL
jgi:hypothetical protein